MFHRDRCLHADVGMKQDLLHLLLLSYNHTWLKLGLEVNRACIRGHGGRYCTQQLVYQTDRQMDIQILSLRWCRPACTVHNSLSSRHTPHPSMVPECIVLPLHVFPSLQTVFGEQVSVSPAETLSQALATFLLERLLSNQQIADTYARPSKTGGFREGRSK